MGDGKKYYTSAMIPHMKENTLGLMLLYRSLLWRTERHAQGRTDADRGIAL